jgi:histidine triad (HIT) family protein
MTDSITTDCIFCKIASGAFNTPAVYEDDKIFAFNDINPAAPTHILIVPRQHIANTAELTVDQEALIGHLMFVAAEIARKVGVEHAGYRLVLNTNADGGQSVFHLHIHLLAGRQLTWPPG